MPTGVDLSFATVLSQGLLMTKGKNNNEVSVSLTTV